MIDIINLSMQYGGRYLFEDTSFKINPTDKIALVGSNGTGKSTLLKLLCGIEEPESGSINSAKGTKTGYLPQEFVSFNENSIFDEVKSSLMDFIALDRKEEKLNQQLVSETNEQAHNKIVEELGEIAHIKEQNNYYEIDSNIEKILLGLGFKKSDLTRSTKEFSGGWIMRIELAKILLGNNQLLLLDEPTNHLDIDSLQWLTQFLIAYKGAILLVSHDREFVNKITNRTLEIFNNKVSYFNGKYDAYLTFKSDREVQLKNEIESRQKKVKEIEQFVERFRYKASKAKQVQSRIKFLDKLDHIETPEYEKEIEIKFPAPPRSGNIPLKIENLSKSFGSLEVFKNVDLTVEHKDKFAFVGPNGAGKTTLSKIIAGRLQASSGEIEFSQNTICSYYAQETTESLTLENEILEEVYQSTEEYTPLQLRSLLGAFLFSNDDVFKKIKVLSGGEKSRVALSKILLTKANLIVLDEPTNHLDFQSKKILQNALMKFEGSLIIVSHDVEFIRPIVNKVVDIRDQKAKVYYGGIDYYFSKRKEEIEGVPNEDQSRGITNSRKEIKRIEAEKRQQKFKATNKLKKELEKTELSIESLEEQKGILENALTLPEVYSDNDKAVETSLNLASVKKELDTHYEKWTELSEKIEEIENQFD